MKKRMRKLIEKIDDLKIRHRIMIAFGLVPFIAFEELHNDFCEAMLLIGEFMDDQCKYNTFLEEEL